jgi:hypothetical protein
MGMKKERGRGREMPSLPLTASARQWMDLKVPLKEFIPVFRGTTLKGADRPTAIDAASIYSVRVHITTRSGSCNRATRTRPRAEHGLWARLM